MPRFIRFADQPGRSALPIVLIVLLTSLITVGIVFTYALPKYFSIDPLGWGAKMEVLSPTTKANNDLSVPALPMQATSPLAVAPSQEIDDPLSVSQDTVELLIPAKQSLDYRLVMERDYELEYHWKTNSSKIDMELRGEAKDGKVASKVFAKMTSNAAKGFFITPFEGQFGWHWENKSDQPVTIKLSTKGHYQVVGQINSSVLKKQ